MQNCQQAPPVRSNRNLTQATDERNPAASLSSAAAQTFKPRDDRSQEKRHETEETKRTQEPSQALKASKPAINLEGTSRRSQSQR